MIFLIISKLFTSFLALVFLVSPFNSRICGLDVQTNQDTASYQILTDNDIKDIKKSRDKFVKFLESRLKEPNDVQILMQILENTKEPNEKVDNQKSRANKGCPWVRFILAGAAMGCAVSSICFLYCKHINSEDEFSSTLSSIND